MHCRSADSFLWKAGVAKTDITPTRTMWLAGFGTRDHKSGGTMHPLHLKVLVLEDAQSNRLVIMCFDLLGITRPVYERTVAALAQLGIEQHQILMNSAHTHSGPAIGGRTYDAYAAMPDSHYAVLDEYTTWLEIKILETTKQALQNLAPSHVF